MVRITESKSAGAVLEYFLESLTQEEFKELKATKEPGQWMGTLATRLGLRGAVTPEAFASMLANLHPFTGKSLTPRTKEDRRTGYEWEVSAPKSLTLLHALTNDAALLRAFVASVREFMKLVQEHAQTRVRVDGADEDRATSELAIAGFLHRTARPVDGIADPHLHAHCFVMNATWDPVEQRIKALQLGNAYSLAPLLETQFFSILAEKVMALGYTVTTKGRFWEIDGVPKSVIDKFSRRTEQIERAAAERGITDAKGLDALGAITREKKRPDMTFGDLKAHWASRLTGGEYAALYAAKDSAERKRAEGQGQHANGTSRTGPGVEREQKKEPHLSPKERNVLAEAIRVTAGKIFERQAVVQERVLLDAGLRSIPGRVRVEHVRLECEAQGIIARVIDNQVMLTTRDAVADEQRLVQVAVSGKGRFVETASTKPRHYSGLSQEQANAVDVVLQSPDLVTIVQGRAGVGKTRLTGVAVKEIADRLNRPVCMLAPTTKATDVLKGEGHKHAGTVAKFLQDEKLQQRARNGLIWVDEAGLLGIKDTTKLLEIAGRLGARVVLMGDDLQNRSVSRGPVLYTLDKHAQVRIVSVEGVLRQRGGYKDLVQCLNRGDVAGALAGLDAMQALRTLPTEDLFKAVAADFVASRANGSKVVLVAPTHAEGREATQEIRQMLKESGKLKGAKMYESLESRGLTEFERGESKSYSPGDVVCFHRRVSSRGRGTFEAGSRWTVLGHDPFNNVVVTQGGFSLPQALPLKVASRFDVYDKRGMEVSVGDSVRFTNSANLYSRLDRLLKLAVPAKQEPTHRVSRGAMHTVTRISPKGTLTLDNGLIVPPTFGHLAHGYCLTSFAAQGITADVVLGLHSKMSGLAASFRQFYVTLTRGRDAVRMYTDDREALVTSITQKEDPTSSLTLLERGVDLKQHDAMKRGAAQQQREMADHARKAAEAAAERQRQQEKGKSL